VGRIILCSLDFLKPDLSKPLISNDATDDNNNDPTSPKSSDKNAKKKPAPLTGFSHFQKARKTTEEMYNEVSNGANMTINTWMSLVGASTMAAGGSTTGVMVFTVAAMLVSPIMGPIMGITLGYRVADWPLFKAGVINEFKMAITCYVMGCLFGLILGDILGHAGNSSYPWPGSQMMTNLEWNLIISIIVSSAAGMVLGVSMTSTGGNALVGTAISAGLLPPLVNAGMLMAYALIYASDDMRGPFYNMGVYNIIFYFTHVVVIVIVANIIFWLKDIDPRFREGEDSNFQDVPTLVQHKQRLLADGKEFTEKDKAEFFIEHIKQDIQNDVKQLASNIKGKALDFASVITGAAPTTGNNRFRRGSQKDNFEEEGEERENQEVHNPLSKKLSTKPRGSGYVSLSRKNIDDEDDIEMQSNPNNASTIIIEDKKNNNNNTAADNSGDSRQKVLAFYRTHNPEKISSGEVDNILLRYSGKEEQLLRLLRKQYNVPDY